MRMLTHGFWGKAALLATWHDFRAPLLAGAVALVLLLLGRVLRFRLLELVALGAGLFVGWAALAGGVASSPHGLLERLPFLALAALALGLGAEFIPVRHAARVAAGLLAVFAGWWLAGAPHARAELLAATPALVGVTLCTGLIFFALENARDPWRLPAACLALCAALYVARAPLMWSDLAAVMLACCIGTLARSGIAATMLAAAAGLAGTSAVLVLAAGRLPHGGIDRLDLAAFAPLLTLWAAPRLAVQWPQAGGALASALAATLSVLIAAGLPALSGVH